MCKRWNKKHAQYSDIQINKINNVWNVTLKIWLSNMQSYEPFFCLACAKHDYAGWLSDKSIPLIYMLLLNNKYLKLKLKITFAKSKFG